MRDKITHILYAKGSLIMDIYVPDYYESFRCIGSSCQDNCCIGWEIDIDSEALDRYMTLGGALGDELRANITRSEDGSDCFKLTDDERCPFLNENNLCRLILAGGEEMLCEICHLHPRFRQWFGDRCETGIGLCCEEAARIIINDPKPFGMHILRSEEGGGELSDFDRRLLHIREELFEIIHRGRSFPELSEELLKRCSEAEKEIFGTQPMRTAVTHNVTYAKDVHFLISYLEPLNAHWKDICAKLSPVYAAPDDRELSGYKNLLSYYIFRYFMKAADDGELFLKAALGVFSAECASLITKCTDLTLEESACLWSKETEYSEENLDMIYDFLYTNFYE